MHCVVPLVRQLTSASLIWQRHQAIPRNLQASAECVGEESVVRTAAPEPGAGAKRAF